mgnify:CR=1 FL=1
MKEKTADEMFKELGYSILDGIENFYTNILIAGKKQKDISFDDIAKDFITISLTKYNEYGNLETNQIVLSVKELQAINKKCKELRLDMMKDREKLSAENSFIKLGYSKIWCEDGFFYYKEKNNKTILFNLKKKEWKIYDYDTEELRGYGEEELKAIFLQEYELNWLNWKEYQAELKCI